MDPQEASNDNGQRAAIERELTNKLQGHRDYLKNLHEPQNGDSETATEALENGDGVVAHPSSHISLNPGGAGPALQTQSVSNHNDPQVPTTAAATTTTQPVTLDGQMAEEQQLEPDVRRIPHPPRRRLRLSTTSGDGLMNVNI